LPNEAQTSTYCRIGPKPPPIALPIFVNQYIMFDHFDAKTNTYLQNDLEAGNHLGRALQRNLHATPNIKATLILKMKN